MAGNLFFDSDEYVYPKPLIEILDKPMIEHAIGSLQNIEHPKRFVFIVNSEDNAKYYIENTLQLLTDENSVIIKLSGHTKGAPCSALMAIDHIDNDSPLIIANGDHIISHDLNVALEHFTEKDCDAGLLCFQSIHPKWSYAKLDVDNNVIETAEKRPISKNAIAGFYYFARGRDFVSAAKRTILKEAHVGGIYFTALVINEMILEGRKIITYQIPNSEYVNFYSPRKISEFESMHMPGRQKP